MKLELKYRGAGIPPNGSIEDKHELRLHFHRQIERKWNTDNRLKTIDRDLIRDAVQRGGSNRFDVQRLPNTSEGVIPWCPEHPLCKFMLRHKVRKVTFIPLVTYVMGAECHLSLRVGRPTRPGSILYEGGDLDGRLKTVFDALRMPHNDGELSPEAEGVGEYQEVMCLLADDSLITKLSIESYELLEDVPNSHYIDVAMSATISAEVPMAGTAALLW